MDIFRFTCPNNPTRLEEGVIINGLKSKMWVERYADAGEFKFTADAKSDMKTKLPIGSFISHIDTSEVMVVENHEVSDSGDGNAKIVISGRGFETILENRIAGRNGGSAPSYQSDYNILNPDYIWNQIIDIIKQNITYAATYYLYGSGGAYTYTYSPDPNDEIPYIDARNAVVVTGEIIPRPFKIMPLYSLISGLLKLENLGLKVVRPNGPATPVFFPTFTPGHTTLYVHKGVDRSSQIVYSYDSGEIETAEYLWTNKANKNAAMVVGQFLLVFVIPPETGIDRRMMIVDATDIDGKYDRATLSGATLALVEDQMSKRGIAALQSQNDVSITKVEVSKQATKAKFRRDFDVGDLISVRGDYNAISTMRVIEYVEIEDETGNTGYPTLAPTY